MLHIAIIKSGDMMFDELIGSNVRVVKRDGFIKHGLLLSTGDGFLKLRFTDGTLYYIAYADVAQVIQNGGDKE